MREETDYTEAIEAYKSDSNIIIEPWGRSIDHLRLTIIGKKELHTVKESSYSKSNSRKTIPLLLHMLMQLH